MTPRTQTWLADLPTNPLPTLLAWEDTALQYFIQRDLLETEVELSYLQLSQRIPGLKCPVCGECYLTEDVVMTTVKEAEELIYGK